VKETLYNKYFESEKGEKTSFKVKEKQKLTSEVEGLYNTLTSGPRNRLPRAPTIKIDNTPNSTTNSTVP
jgi:hypothetical protein